MADDAQDMKTTFSKHIRLIFAFCATLATGAATGTADQLVGINLVPQLAISGTPGATDQIQYCTNLSQPTWIVLTNIPVQTVNYSFVDSTAPSSPPRFYRVVRYTPQGMVLIPAGSFTMGDTADGTVIAVPVHTVYVSGFFMDQGPVTKALWDTVKTWSSGNGYGYDHAGAGKADAHPVQSVSWFDCVKWCNARSEKEGRTPCYYADAGVTAVYKTGTNLPYAKWDANGYRLPTEAEWEKAARGGISGQRFPWGNTISWGQANYYASPAPAAGSVPYDVNPTAGYIPNFNDGVMPYTSPPGYFAGNAYGLYDMSGNVWEWCWDWYDNYTNTSQADPRGPVDGPGRVYRGGAWNSPAFMCRVPGRYNSAPDSTFNSLGFRCVMPVPAGQ